MYCLYRITYTYSTLNLKDRRNIGSPCLSTVATLEISAHNLFYLLVIRRKLYSHQGEGGGRIRKFASVICNVTFWRNEGPSWSEIVQILRRQHDWRRFPYAPTPYTLIVIQHLVLLQNTAFIRAIMKNTLFTPFLQL